MTKVVKQTASKQKYHKAIQLFVFFFFFLYIYMDVRI